MPHFIVIEGLHGVGKSSVAAELARQLGTSIFPSLPNEYHEIRRFVDSGRNLDLRFSVYLAALLQTSLRVSEELRAGRDVVMESYFYRTVAFHRGMGSRLNADVLDSVPMPTLAYHLTCNQDERVRRMNSRNRSAQRTHWDEVAEKNSEAILHEYQRFNLVAVDTTNLSVEDVVHRIVSDLKTERKA